MEKVRTRSGGDESMLFFVAPARGKAFSSQAADLTPDRRSGDHFGKGGGGVGGPDWSMVFFMAPARGGAFPNRAPDLIPNGKSGHHFGKGGGGVRGVTGQ